MKRKKTTKQKVGIFALLVAVCVVPVAVGGWQEYQKKRRWQEYQDSIETRRECDRIERALKEYYDSIALADRPSPQPSPSMGRENGAGAVKVPSTSLRMTSGGYEDEEDAREHPGTPPDDGMFGFDYWDDEDDAYEMDRNQTDAYPDEW